MTFILDYKFKKSQLGFTLVELLVVISLVGILAGITIALINPVKQRDLAEDGVRRSNLQKYALGIEAYANATNSYPISVAFDSDKRPTSPVDLKEYISKIPDKEPSETAVYTYTGDATYAEFFVITVPLKSDSTKCLKYHSKTGKILECNVIAGCSSGNFADATKCL